MKGRIGIGVCSSLCVLTITIGLLSGRLFAGYGLAPRSDRETGTLRVLVKHKLLPVEQVKPASVTVARIEVRNGENDDDWIVIQEGEQVINLLDMGGGRTSVLASADVASGQYTQMRLICTGGSIAVDNDSSLSRQRDLPLDKPDGERAAIHLNCDFAVSAGSQTTVLIDEGIEETLHAMVDNRRSDGDEVAGFHLEPPVKTAR